MKQTGYIVSNMAEIGEAEDFLKLSIFFTFSLLSPVGQEHDPSFEQSYIPSTPRDTFCQVLLK